MFSDLHIIHREGSSFTWLSDSKVNKGLPISGYWMYLCSKQMDDKEWVRFIPAWS